MWVTTHLYVVLPAQPPLGPHRNQQQQLPKDRPLPRCLGTQCQGRLITYRVGARDYERSEEGGSRVGAQPMTQKAGMESVCRVHSGTSGQRVLYPFRDEKGGNIPPAPRLSGEACLVTLESGLPWRPSPPLFLSEAGCACLLGGKHFVRDCCSYS